MRRLIICHDGTWNTPDEKDRGKAKPTNITKISRALKPIAADQTSQIVFYDEGVGTGFGQKALGGITGFGLSENVLEAYRFLSHNYSAGDEIFLFGFSRGAFTARSLAGFISLVGIIEKDDVFYLPRLWDLYKTQASIQEVNEFYQSKAIHNHRPRIKMIGVFDTVGALGVPLRGVNSVLQGLKLIEFKFHDVSLSEIVDNAYQALAVDEHRVPFAPSVWRKPPNSNTKLEQRWFAGVHSNIGGGYNPDDYANLALQYMVGKGRECGLEFDDQYLSFFHGDVDGAIRDSMSFKYRLLGKNIREITLGDDSNQVIDQSVRDKITSDSGYRPENIPST